MGKRKRAGIAFAFYIYALTEKGLTSEASTVDKINTKRTNDSGEVLTFCARALYVNCV